MGVNDKSLNKEYFPIGDNPATGALRILGDFIGKNHANSGTSTLRCDKKIILHSDIRKALKYQ